MARPVGPRNTIVFGIGVVMMALGAYVGARTFWLGAQPVGGSRLLSFAFTLFFLVRGWMNVRSATGRPVFGGPRSGV